ncbi:Aste57867_9082 [Aphanomyces stellatus]|uniref:Aste57867_9082 protein n=1 Tax=Aphanomyces stellatus TaxID=120398 RepID=A0A485KLY6_9STRA|nr:hypothetical protein As57867_009046 [Aphanomyces stellatus]VFT85966.1 Aste57867_9082 [Aphanomyces stellatus]
MAFACPCVSVAQISSRLGVFGGYTRVLPLACLAILGSFASAFVNCRTQSIFDDAKLASREAAGRMHVDIVVPVLAIACSVSFVVFVTRLRALVRTRLSLPGTACGDFLCACCLPCCAIAHMSAVVSPNRACGFGPWDTTTDILPAYKTT